MRLVVRVPHESQHRGYRIEGEKRGEGFLLQVTAMRAGLPQLPWARFRIIRGSWDKGAHDVASYIDDYLGPAATNHGTRVKT
jgi:hypothetical protein